MIHQLRGRFVRISVAVLTVAMLLLALVINAVNWVYVRQDLAELAGELAESSASGGLTDFSTPGDGHGKDNKDGKDGKDRNGRRRDEESFYASRYFIVTYGKNSVSTDLSQVSSYTEAEAESMGDAARSSSADSGLMGGCFYRKYSSGGREAILFLDCGSRLSAVRQLLVISLVVCAAGILLAWLLMTRLSKTAIRPFLENSERQKRFITDASHELKTPLSVISANMDVLAMDDPENEWVQSTRRQIGRMNRMVRDLVFLARADEETKPVQTGFDLASLVKDTAEPFASMAEAAGKTFTLETPESLPAQGDEKGIERLISVLCDNALRYSPEKDVISLRLSRKAALAVLETENAPGEPLSEEKLSHLFDRFYRADESRTTSGGKTGFGIGLAIVRAVAESHGGSVKAEMRGGRLVIRITLAVCVSSGGKGKNT